MIIGEYKKIKKNILFAYCKQEDELLKNNCLIAELFDAQLTDATDENPIIIKGGIGELKITKNKNYYIPNPHSWTAKVTQEHLITYFDSVKTKNRKKTKMDEKPLTSDYVYDRAKKLVERKNYLEKNRISRGLGDTIEKFTIFTGIKPLVKRIFGETDCGCNRRRDILNKWFPYKRWNFKKNTK